MTPPLRPYQRVAIAFLRGRGRCGLYLDMGLGKTRCCIEAIEERNLPVLVVAPPRVAQTVWHAEVEKWRPDLTVARAIGGPKERAEAISAGADITTISMNSMADLISGRGTKKDPYVLLGRRYRTVIFDEVSRMRGRGTWWKQARGFSACVEFVWTLTGTPASNGSADLWPIIYLIDKGRRLGHNITEFRRRWFRAGRSGPDGVPYEWFENEGAEAEIWSAIEDITLSMKSEGLVDLPPVTYNWIDVPIPEKCRKPYNEMKRELATDLSVLFDSEVLTAKNAAVATSKLSQICAGFSYVNDQDLRGGKHTIMHDERLKALAEIREEVDSPLLVIYEFKPERQMILDAFPDALTIDEPDVVERWNAGKIPLLVAHCGAMAHGLNMQSGPGRTLVFMTVPWDLEAYQQTIGRLARPGQANPVVVHHLVSPKTVDVVKRARLAEKADVQDRLMEHLVSPV